MQHVDYSPWEVASMCSVMLKIIECWSICSLVARCFVRTIKGSITAGLFASLNTYGNAKTFIVKMDDRTSSIYTV